MKYHVVIKETEVYVLTVEADSQTDALIKAEELVDNAEKHEYHDSSEYESDATEV